MQRFRFTVVDDDPDILFSVQKMLSKSFPGSQVASFSNPQDALNHLMTAGADLLVTNHVMPSMNGMELMRELRNDNVNIPIIMMSGNPAARNEALAAGANEFLDKPVASQTLESRIRGLLKA